MRFCSMLCQICNQEEATVFINVLMNDSKAETLKLCEECHDEMNPQKLLEDAIKNGQFNGELPDPKELFNMIFGTQEASKEEHTVKTKTKEKKRVQNSLLDKIGKNLNQQAAEGKINAVIGRKKEIDEVVETLNRLNKNNPVLIGEPGVGKTAIAEALALEIINGNVPEHLLDKEVYLIDVASLVAGTGIRGQFEEKIKALIADVQRRGNVILFIDELHLLVGAGSGEGSMDASNILKPALARGEIQIVGATTLREYRIIEKDGALERRFQPVMVNEPTEEETFDILKGIVARYEKHHQVTYSDDVIQQCISLSTRYMQERKHPDKAIDLLDISGSKVSIKHNKKQSRKVKIELDNVSKQKQLAVIEEAFEKAATLRSEELSLIKLYNELKEKEENMPKSSLPKVTVEDIQEIIEQKTGIPVTKIQSEEQSKMKNLAETLGSNVIGQTKAVEKVAKAIRRSRAGLKPKNRPTGSFLFIGPTGVGKTELTKQLAAALFGSKENMIRIDMSEYMEKHTVSKLIGSPPGYIGHNEAGGLTEQVRRKPYSIVLLDEIEKAHPDVLNILLQILEDGRLTDSHGKVVSFKDTVIIATSNAGTGVKKPNTLGFGAMETETMKENTLIESLKPYFRPEFLNRFDSIIEFKQLEEKELVSIVDLLIADLQTTLAEQSVTLNVTADAKKKLASLGYNSQFGARPLRRTIQEMIEDKVADLLLDEENVKAIKVGVRKDEIYVESV